MECDGRFLIVSLEALWDEKLQYWPNFHFCPVMIQCEQFWTILAIFITIPLFSRLHKRNGVLYFCSDENRKAMNEFTGVQHLSVLISYSYFALYFDAVYLKKQRSPTKCKVTTWKIAFFSLPKKHASFTPGTQWMGLHHRQMTTFSSLNSNFS